MSTQVGPISGKWSDIFNVISLKPSYVSSIHPRLTRLPGTSTIFHRHPLHLVTGGRQWCLLMYEVIGRVLNFFNNCVTY